MRSHLLLLSISMTLLACADPLKADEDGDGAAITVDCDDNDPSLGSTLEDADCDGALTADDCDDEDESSPIKAEDGDCDGTPTADDCDDADANSTIMADDGDCDGVLTTDDCDDTDASSTIVAEDGDCDGTLTADDCDDTDASSTIVAEDGDCDGTLTADDCDDTDASLDNADIDNDGYSTCDGDCEDSDATLELADADNDGYSSCDGDCDDTESESYPGNLEVCDGIDNDCDSSTPEPDESMLTFSGGSTATCCCTGGNSGNSYILADVSSSLSGASTATIEFWLYLDTYTQYGAIMWSEGTGNNGLGVSNTSDCGYGSNRYKTAGSWGAAGKYSSSTATLSTWQHYALVFDNGTVTYFVDGVSQGSASAGSSTTPSIPNDWLYFGGKTAASNGNNQHQVNGSYRSIRISSSARYSGSFTPDDIFVADSDTMHLYELNENTGYTVYDSVDSTMIGTIVNGSKANETWSIYEACPY